MQQFHYRLNMQNGWETTSVPMKAAMKANARVCAAEEAREEGRHVSLAEFIRRATQARIDARANGGPDEP